MILTLIEEKSRDIEQSRERERAANKLLVQLSQITSRLLAGSDPASLAGEVTVAVTDASSFSALRYSSPAKIVRCALAESLAFRPRKRTRLKSARGLDNRKVEELASRASNWEINLSA